jgi:hypothetical protein
MAVITSTTTDGSTIVNRISDAAYSVNRLSLWSRWLTTDAYLRRMAGLGDALKDAAAWLDQSGEGGEARAEVWRAWERGAETWRQWGGN